MDLFATKKEFIHFMESINTGLLYPKKFFGCMMAVFIEQDPITQDQLHKLTGYSKTTISQMLRLIQLNFPVKQFKKPQNRKKYYHIDLPPQEFMIIFLQMIMESYRDRPDFFLPFIKELEPYAPRHPRFRHFKEFLEQFYTLSKLSFQLITDTTEEFQNLIRSRMAKSNDSFLPDAILSPSEKQLVQELLKPPEVPTSFDPDPIRDPELAKTYTALKKKYYQEFTANMSSGESQILLARSIIGTELLLENRPLTQEEIQAAVGFQRSIISEALSLLVKWKMVQVIKRPKDRKKYYFVIQSWDHRIINRFQLNLQYAKNVQAKIQALTAELNPQNKQDEAHLQKRFQEIYQVYRKFERYIQYLQITYLRKRISSLR